MAKFTFAINLIAKKINVRRILHFDSRPLSFDIGILTLLPRGSQKRNLLEDIVDSGESPVGSKKQSQPCVSFFMYVQIQKYHEIFDLDLK